MSEAVLADQSIDVGSIEVGGLGDRGDVAAVALQQALQVFALALVDPALAKFLERLVERDRGQVRAAR
jgi:hypothetical protein